MDSEPCNNSIHNSADSNNAAEDSRAKGDGPAPPSSSASTLEPSAPRKADIKASNVKAGLAGVNQDTTSVTSSTTSALAPSANAVYKDRANSASTSPRNPPSSSPLLAEKAAPGTPSGPTSSHINSFPASQDIMLMTPSAARLNASPTQYSSDNFSSPSTPLGQSPSAYMFSLPKSSGPQPNSPTPQKSKPYVCSECNQTFSRQHNLKSHALTHSHEKPFQCEVCHHFFRRHHDLKRHAKLHTGEKPYTCQHCKRSFARLDALNRHLRAESFCGGPQKKLFQNSNVQSPLQQSPLDAAPQSDQQTPTAQPQTPSRAQPQTPQPQTQPQFKHSPMSSTEKTPLSAASSPPLAQNDASVGPQELLKHRQSEQYKKPQWSSPQGSPLQSKASPPASTSSASVQSALTRAPSVKPALPNLIIPTRSSSAPTQYVFHVDSSTPSNPSSGQPGHHRASAIQYPSTEYDLHYKESGRKFDGSEGDDGQEIGKLRERNEFLERRVRELEDEVVSERKQRTVKEYLENRVKELEIEKNLLKSLLLERDNQQDVRRNDKKRKASTLIEQTTPKHQKDGEGATLLSQTAQ